MVAIVRLIDNAWFITEEQPMPANDNDPINPEHYKSHTSGIECIEITRHMGFNLGNVVKYVWRSAANTLPGGKQLEVVEDLKKARWYLDDEIKRLEQMVSPKGPP